MMKTIMFICQYLKFYFLNLYIYYNHITHDPPPRSTLLLKGFMTLELEECMTYTLS